MIAAAAIIIRIVIGGVRVSAGVTATIATLIAVLIWAIDIAGTIRWIYVGLRACLRIISGCDRWIDWTWAIAAFYAARWQAQYSENQ